MLFYLSKLSKDSQSFLNTYRHESSKVQDSSNSMEETKHTSTTSRRTTYMRCESSVTSTSSSDIKIDYSKILRSFSEDDLKNCPSKRCLVNPAISGIRADYLSYQASHPINGSYNVTGEKHASFEFSDSANLSHQLKSSNTIVVLPSIDLDQTELKRMRCVAEIYEERQLYHLFLLVRDPSFRIIFVSTYPVDNETVRYYLSLDGCSEVDLKERLSRLVLLHPEGHDNTCHSLSQKVMKSDKLLHTIRSIVFNEALGDTPTCGISFFCGSDMADAITAKLKLRQLEANGNNLYFGSKQGSREIFHFCDVPCAPGTPDFGDEDLLSVPDCVDTWSLRHRFICKPRDLAIGLARQITKGVKPAKWVVKLNQGFSGKGNACLQIQAIQNSTYRDSVSGHELTGSILVNAMADDIEKEFPNMEFECTCNSWNASSTNASFVEQMSRLGVIAEALMEGEKVTSPSVQAVIDPNIVGKHRVEILSTHEQVLCGQVYIGCINPAAKPYRSEIVEYTLRMGEEMAKHGAVGHFSADFIAAKKRINDRDEWTITGIEINLRQGGTTHPYSAMATLCGGRACSDGVFRTREGHERCYVATDNYIDCRLSGLTSASFLQAYLSNIDPDIEKLRWDDDKKVGVIFHLVPFLVMGKIGFTAIGSTSSQASDFFDGVTNMLRAIAEKRQQLH